MPLNEKEVLDQVEELDADWIGALKCKFNWRTLSFGVGRYHYKTNALGQTLESKFVWEKLDAK